MWEERPAPLLSLVFNGLQALLKSAFNRRLNSGIGTGITYSLSVPHDALCARHLGATAGLAGTGLDHGHDPELVLGDCESLRQQRHDVHGCRCHSHAHTGYRLRRHLPQRREFVRHAGRILHRLGLGQALVRYQHHPAWIRLMRESQRLPNAHGHRGL